MESTGGVEESDAVSVRMCIDHKSGTDVFSKGKRDRTGVFHLPSPCNRLQC